ncbi:transposase [Acidobacteria bacterium AH-259-G07]|nr:transposase [Acidobacteria bacterium AH-259-G07]
MAPRILRAGNSDYVLKSDALDYMRAQKLPRAQLEGLAANKKRSFASERSWKAVLGALNFTDERHIRIATEGALLGSVLEHGLNPELVIVSDDAGQFDVLRHALCWVHAERIVNKLVGFNQKQRQAVQEIRTWIWDLYADLKTYKQAPSDQKKAELEAPFDEIFGTKSCFVSLNLTLQRIRQNKSELLLVLERPDIPLHNNLSERDIREYVKKRKISGSTRSALGRRCRDTFTSLKKTCRKLGISFWEYLKDRVSGKNTIPPLTDLMRQRARNPPRPLVENVA